MSLSAQGSSHVGVVRSSRAAGSGLPEPGGCRNPEALEPPCRSSVPRHAHRVLAMPARNARAGLPEGSISGRAAARPDGAGVRGSPRRRLRADRTVGQLAHHDTLLVREDVERGGLRLGSSPAGRRRSRSDRTVEAEHLATRSPSGLPLRPRAARHRALRAAARCEPTPPRLWPVGLPSSSTTIARPRPAGGPVPGAAAAGSRLRRRPAISPLPPRHGHRLAGEALYERGQGAPWSDDRGESSRHSRRDHHALRPARRAGPPAVRGAYPGYVRWSFRWNASTSGFASRGRSGRRTPPHARRSSRSRDRPVRVSSSYIVVSRFQDTPAETATARPSSPPALCGPSATRQDSAKGSRGSSVFRQVRQASNHAGVSNPGTPSC